MIKMQKYIFQIYKINVDKDISTIQVMCQCMIRMEEMQLDYHFS